MAHRKSHRAYIHRAHYWIIATFIVLRAVEAFAFHSCYQAHQRALLAVIVNANIITIALLAAVWFRQPWARFALIILISLLLALGISFPAFLQGFFLDKYAAVMSVCGVGYIAAVIFLIFPPSMNKLTNRAFV